MVNTDLASSSNSSTSSNRSYVSIEIAKDMLTRFDGSKHKLHEFIDNCDKANQYVKPELKNILFAIIETRITDNARAVIRNRSFNNWQELKQHLLDLYSEKRTMSQWQLELNSCRQNVGENVLSFSNKIEHCYVKLINSLDEDLTREARTACTDLLKNEALRIFISGLNKDLALIVKSQKPDSLESAIALALVEEQELKSKADIFKYQNVNNSYAKLCNICNKSGHTTFNCRYKNQQPPNNKNQFQNNKRQFHINQVQGSSQNSHRSSNHNPNSNQNNSNNYNSNYNSKFCNYCKKNGHVISECRKREYNNNKRENKQYHNSDTPQSYNSHLNSQRAQPNSAKPRNANFVQAESQQ
ncbi:uncharacterized protein [Onthophagus taurus]|uniref:uncharacterized protein n=1 Tax=Onthophagus taurus TaxID=166361 RepID=UPI0039BDB911